MLSDGEGDPRSFGSQEHVQRLFNSAKIYRTRIPFSQEEVITAIKDTIQANELGGLLHTTHRVSGTWEPLV